MRNTSHWHAGWPSPCNNERHHPARAVGGPAHRTAARHTLGDMADRNSGIDPADVARVRELAEAVRAASP